MKSSQLFTLCFPIKDERILLEQKLRGKTKGLWLGFGGKVEEGEDIISAAVREIREEAHLGVKDLELMTIIDF